MRVKMAWKAPKIEEVTCGMEINMYFPAEAEETLFWSTWIGCDKKTRFPVGKVRFFYLAGQRAW